MFYYTINKSISNIYDNQPLQVKGFVGVYEDEAKTMLLTQIPFSEINVNLSVADCPTDSAENFNMFVEDKALKGMNNEELQTKLEQVKVMKDLGLLN